MENYPEIQGSVCPVPLPHNETIVMGHGSGGLLTRDLINQIFLPAFSNPSLLAGNDFALLDSESNSRIVVSTDAHIVTPLFFPGGDIGRLAVSGTINDIAVSGGTPLGLTASFILEEGLPLEVLAKVAQSMAVTALEAEVPIVAGDTKVVEHGKADGLFISTTGIAKISSDTNINGANAQPGDAVLISGTLGDHGMAVLAARGELGVVSQIRSDTAPLNHLIRNMLQVCPQIHAMRDPTRGGLATTLNEIAQQSNVGITIRENWIPVRPEVNALCELLGFDPLYVANEGKVIVILPEPFAEKVLEEMHKHPYGIDAKQIGWVHAEAAGEVHLATRIGGTRLLSVMSGEMLPRIC
jgi:hydrogenase expression/formation protein HypE